MAVVLHGKQRQWGGEADDDGHKEYFAELLFRGEHGDGPAAVIAAANLAYPPGTTWAFDDDGDQWAFRKRKVGLKTHGRERGVGKLWLVTLTWSTRPDKACQDEAVEDPLLAPMKVSGGSVKDKEEAAFDRFGQPIVTSSWEPIRGPLVEFDTGRDTVKVEQNVALLELGLLSLMRNSVNDAPLWGAPARAVKFSDYQWSEEFRGNCYKYYKRTLTFDVFIRPDPLTGLPTSGHDRLLPDEGTKALNGKWRTTAPYDWELLDIAGEPPDRFNPAHFTRYRDRQGNYGKVMLDGEGRPFDPAPPATTDECLECPDGMPEQWQVGGFPEEVILTHTGTCNWDGAGVTSGGVVSLVFDTDDGLWRLTHSSYPGSQWVATGEWACEAPNGLVQVVFGGLGPGAVYVTPYKDTQVGKVRVEKYPSANLLLLGVPTQLGP
jgi:hypothetical protein